MDFEKFISSLADISVDMFADEVLYLEEVNRLKTEFIKNMEVKKSAQVKIIEKKLSGEGSLEEKVEAQTQLIELYEKLDEQKSNIISGQSSIIFQKGIVIEDQSKMIAAQKKEIKILRAVVEHYKEKEKTAKELVVELTRMKRCQLDKCCGAIKAALVVWKNETSETQWVITLRHL